jgi:acyl carrier protein
MITPEEAHKNIKESLVGFPKEVTEAYLVFASKADMESLDKVVTGILQFYLAKAPKSALSEMPGTTRLREDLGMDSLTMMDTVFLVEGLFSIKLEDDELVKLSTLDDLRQLIHSRFPSLSKSK